MIEDIDIIPMGWRRLEVGETKLAGDKFCVKGFWHETGLAGKKVADDDLTFIRALNTHSPNPNSHNLTFQPLEIERPITVTVTDRVKKYLKISNA